MNILIVEDDRDTSDVLKAVLGTQKYGATQAFSGKSALEMAETLPFESVILDMVLPDIDGLVVLEKIKQEDPSLPVVILTGHADVQSAVKAMKLGAVDYLVKPFGNDELLLVIEKAVKERRFLKEFEALKNHVSNFYSGGNVFGDSPEIKQVTELANQVAKTDLTVILSGPSGSGKEVWARHIHNLSLRNKNPFVALDCGALPENLVESELFGYEKGAFTGADRRKLGLFEIAFGGTLFLDEISNLDFPIQSKLLRVLQERRIRHLGGKKDIPVDVRIITATNKNLQSCIKEGAFREDLYHRLNQFSIVLPGLAERKKDIRPLAAFFLQDANKTLKKKVKTISEEAFVILESYVWPGNIRELKNAITRAALIADDEIKSEHLDLVTKEINLKFAGASAAPEELTKKTDLNLKNTVKPVIKNIEKDLITEALKRTAGNKLKATKLLGIDRKALYYKLKEYKIKIES
ncbi:MAG: sigma-54-dependent Fis family transcriptional regulator [Elusimicrobia bacterium]|nr:sigma-54-dependent Fis family transcriptional regulator [Elusimicrobiota bacterium]